MAADPTWFAPPPIHALWRSRNSGVGTLPDAGSDGQLAEVRDHSDAGGARFPEHPGGRGGRFPGRPTAGPRGDDRARRPAPRRRRRPRRLRQDHAARLARRGTAPRRPAGPPGPARPRRGARPGHRAAGRRRAPLLAGRAAAARPGWPPNRTATWWWRTGRGRARPGPRPWARPWPCTARRSCSTCWTAPGCWPGPPCDWAGRPGATRRPANRPRSGPVSRSWSGW